MADIITIGENFAVEDRFNHDALKSGANPIKIKTDQSHTTTKIINSIIEKHSSDEYQVLPRSSH